MPQVVALYRYPVKGFTPESVPSLVVQPDGRIAGDRALAFRFARAATPNVRDGLDYWPKAQGLSLQDFPSLARLLMNFDDATGVVSITHGASVLVEAGLDDEGRDQLSAAVTDYVLASPEAARLGGPGRLPLVLVGDGVASRFQDSPRGYVSLHSAESVAALQAVLAMGTGGGDGAGEGAGAGGGAEPGPVDDRRFRSNVVIEGVEAWHELAWEGELRIGDVVLRTDKPIVRCLATHANPDSGVRDAPVLTTLTGEIGQREPTLGRFLLPVGEGGVIRVGDEVRVGGGGAAGGGGAGAFGGAGRGGAAAETGAVGGTR